MDEHCVAIVVDVSQQPSALLDRVGGGGVSDHPNLGRIVRPQMTRRLASELILVLETRNLDGPEIRASMTVDGVRGELVVRCREEIWVGGLALRHDEDGLRVRCSTQIRLTRGSCVEYWGVTVGLKRV